MSHDFGLWVYVCWNSICEDYLKYGMRVLSSTEDMCFLPDTWRPFRWVHLFIILSVLSRGLGNDRRSSEEPFIFESPPIATRSQITSFLIIYDQTPYFVSSFPYCQIVSLHIWTKSWSCQAQLKTMYLRSHPLQNRPVLPHPLAPVALPLSV